MKAKRTAIKSTSHKKAKNNEPEQPDYEQALLFPLLHPLFDMVLPGSCSGSVPVKEVPPQPPCNGTN